MASRRAVLLERTEIDPTGSTRNALSYVEDWATRWQIPAPWLIDWAGEARITWLTARCATRSHFYEAWDRYRADNPETWFLDLVDAEPLCGTARCLPEQERDPENTSLNLQHEELLNGFLPWPEHLPDRVLDPDDPNSDEAPPLDALNPLLETRDDFIRRAAIASDRACRYNPYVPLRIDLNSRRTLIGQRGATCAVRPPKRLRIMTADPSRPFGSPCAQLRSYSTSRLYGVGGRESLHRKIHSWPASPNYLFPWARCCCTIATAGA